MSKKGHRKQWFNQYGAWIELQKGHSVYAYDGYDCLTETPTATYHPDFLEGPTVKAFEHFLSYAQFSTIPEEAK